MMATISPYSIAVAPRWLFNKRVDAMTSGAFLKWLSMRVPDVRNESVSKRL